MMLYSSDYLLQCAFSKTGGQHARADVQYLFSVMAHPDLSRLRSFVARFSALLDEKPDEGRIIAEGSALLSSLVGQDDWLPDSMAEPSAENYRQYLLYLDTAERFSIVSFVWGPGQTTPIHDHGTWGLIGMLRGAETSEAFQRSAQGGMISAGPPIRLEPGDVEHVSPATGDIHRVANALEDGVSISIHVYGVDIGRWPRTAYSESGEEKPFVSGYFNASGLNLEGK